MGNQNQTKNKERRQAQVDDDADVRIRRTAAAEHVNDPEADQYQGRCCGKTDSNKADGVVRKENARLDPALFDTLGLSHSSGSLQFISAACGCRQLRP